MLYPVYMDLRVGDSGMALVPPQIPVTVSVQPGKTGSEALLRKLGFQQVCWNDPWFEYVLEG